MANYQAGTAVFISVIAGLILSIFFDGVFTLAFTGFMATYITTKEEQSTSVGVIASLTLGILIFIYGLVAGPEIPYEVSSIVSLDLFSFSVGFIIVCLLSVSLGALGGFIATKVSNYKITR